MLDSFEMPCRRHNCPHSHLESPRNHGFCCNACKRGEEFHTHDCTGYVRHSQRKRPKNCQVVSFGFRIPLSWISGPDLHDHVDWYMSRFGLTMTADAQRTWGILQTILNGHPVNRGRELLICVGRQQDAVLGHGINCANYNLTAHNNELYDSSTVSGVYFEVQAVLLSQRASAEILATAVTKIEVDDLDFVHL